MKDTSLYLCQLEKGKRTRIKICFENSLAKAIVVTCFVPKLAGMPFTWKISNLNWNTGVEQGRKDLEAFISAYQKEEKQNFKIALAEAAEYNRQFGKRELKPEIAVLGKFLKPFISKAHSQKKPIFNALRPSHKGNVLSKSNPTPSGSSNTSELVSREEIIGKILTLKKDRS